VAETATGAETKNNNNKNNIKLNKYLGYEDAKSG
jgi:hypothetical protein